jgi:hypothetical protein
MSQEAPTKICTSCGQRKPLSAFLQMNKAGTASHGQICANCRKTLAENAKRPQGEDAGTQETGHKIDTKARMKAENDKRQLVTEVHENYHENRDINATDAKFSEQKQAIKQETEKKIRTSMFGRQGFLSEKKQTPTTQATTEAQQQAHAETQIQTEQQNTKEDRQKTQHDPSALQLDSAVAGQIRFQSTSFQKTRQEFLRRLGKDSPFMRAAENANKTNEKNKTKETLEEHVEKTWEPTRPKR